MSSTEMKKLMINSKPKLYKYTQISLFMQFTEEIRGEECDIMYARKLHSEDEIDQRISYGYLFAFKKKW